METLDPQELHQRTAYSYLRRRIAGGLFIIVGMLVLSLIGGASGFVLLSSSKVAWVTTLRSKLGVDTANGHLSIPVTENIRVEESSAVIDASKKVLPAVVAISASQQVTDFFGNTTTQDVGGGSGFVITADGLILTNKHVIADQATYKVVLNDGRIFDAKVQAIDPSNDLAVVKIDAHDLPTVELGSSDALQIGQFVIAVGNPLAQYRNSVSFGVISAKQRQVTASGGAVGTETLTGLLQTDAAINPGNSGGPLVNLGGQVIGINTAIASNGGGSIGIGFAIPIDSIKSVIDSVRKTGQIIRPYLGVRYIPIDSSVQQQNQLSVNYGALVARGQTATQLAVLPGSPADKAGVQENDIILSLNGDRIDTDNPLSKWLQKYNVGDTVTLTILRHGNQQDLKVTLDKAPNVTP